MDIAYVDESGSAGFAGSTTFTLGCVVVTADQWPAAFDGMIGFRQFLRDRFAIPVRAELKANYLLHNGGPLRASPLSEQARHDVYRQYMRLMPKLELRVFAVVIRKAELAALGATEDPRDVRGSTSSNDLNA